MSISTPTVKLLALLLIFVVAGATVFNIVWTNGVFHYIFFPQQTAESSTESPTPEFLPIGPVPSMPFSLSDVSPQLVTTLSHNDATRDTYQRKVFYDGNNFFIWFLNSSSRQLDYTASQKGVLWTVPIAKVNLGTKINNTGTNVDVQYPNRGTLGNDGRPCAFEIMFLGYSEQFFYWYAYSISGTSITQHGSVASGAFTKPQGGSILSSLDGINDYVVYMFYFTINYVRIIKVPAGAVVANINTVAVDTNLTGGCQILPYQTASPWNTLILAKDSSNVLYYNVGFGSFTSIATLTTGFSDWCGCSQAQSIGAPQIVDMVYIKNTGQLCYRSFNGTLSNEFVLVPSGDMSRNCFGCIWKSLRVLCPKRCNSVDDVQWCIMGNTISLLCLSYVQQPHLLVHESIRSERRNLPRLMEGTNAPYQLWFATIGA